MDRRSHAKSPRWLACALVAVSFAGPAAAQSQPRGAIARPVAPRRAPNAARPSGLRSVLGWRAPRGNDGAPPPSSGPEWNAFNGHPPAEHVARWNEPAHHDPVPQPGVRASSEAPPARALPVAAIARALQARGVRNTAVAGRAAQNVVLGLPSEATVASRDDLLIARRDAVISYNARLRGPNWVAWRTSRANLPPPGGHSMRSDDHWRADPSLPADVTPATFHDYEASGYDPGHMVRSGERTNNPRANQRTYVMTNVLPQAFNNNRGPWLRFEDYYLDLVRNEGAEVQVVAGGVFGREPLRIGAGVAVPSATWKVVAVLRPGQGPEDIDESTRVIAVVIPNSDREVAMGAGFAQYVTTPAEVERMTGLRFFTNLPAHVADALRNRRDPVGAPAPSPRPSH